MIASPSGKPDTAHHYTPSPSAEEFNTKRPSVRPFLSSFENRWTKEPAQVSSTGVLSLLSGSVSHPLKRQQAKKRKPRQSHLSAGKEGERSTHLNYAKKSQRA
jgi:hypothetical protein